MSGAGHRRQRGLTVQRDTNLVDREVYCAETAERKYQENLRAKGPDLKIGNDHELAEYIENKIADEDDTLAVQRWVNEYPRGILGGKCAGRVLLELAQEARIVGLELLL